MFDSISLGIILLLFGCVHSQEECVKVCAQTQTTEKAQAACKEGCRLQVILAFASSSDVISTRDDCYNACVKSYNADVEKRSCSFGCDSRPNMKKSRIHISVTDKSPMFEVVRKAMGKMMHRLSNSFPSLGGFDSSSSEEDGEQILGDPFAQLHFHMQNEMARLHQIAQNVLNLQRTQTLTPVIAKNRPEGHEQNAMEGFPVENSDENGEKIVEVKPVKMNKEERFLGYEGENPTVVEVPESSLLSRLASRARRLSVLSQWLICVALFLCFVSMLSISVAILKQIKSQKYLNLRNMHSIVPPTFAHVAKKIPLESTAVVTDYPLIHDSPPPAYDQLSIHKEKSEKSADHSDPKV